MIAGCNYNNKQTETVSLTTDNTKETELVQNVSKSTVCTEITEETEMTEPEIETTVSSENSLDSEQIEQENDFIDEPTEETKENVSEYQNLISLGEFRLTAYCSCKICCGEFAINRPVDEDGKEIVYGSIGVRLVEGISIVVDPDVIKYGSKVVIGDHTYIAQDTGGAIEGNRIDVYFEDHQRASDFGTQYRIVYLVQE